ncbi:peroxisomal succinyl-coenzyme A thioesterase-like [Mirounga angustirostris]|uniref:peroxisomal succinyl-coenzyme A thioesterase-like n=1 Tax=Mirounga angustirostris TaxID=9716 RepID=UPI0023E42A10|nr:peroxisomal succinyl-coenzyme A thioesterase-like [Mirounga angustirostris]
MTGPAGGPTALRTRGCPTGPRPAPPRPAPPPPALRAGRFDSAYGRRPAACLSPEPRRSRGHVEGCPGRARNPRDPPPPPEVDVHIGPSLPEGCDPDRHAYDWAGRRAPGHESGLGPRERVTLRASAVSYRGRLFHSLAHYEADGHGGSDLARDPALGGDFTGVEPLGLLWSLTPVGSEDPCFSQMPRGVMKSPLKVEGTVHHAPRQPAVSLGPALASAQVQRWFSSPELRRARLQAGRLRPGASSCCPRVREVFSAEGFAWI